MPIDRPLRTLAAACLALATLLAVAAAPAFALEPPRPLPGYRATFVTQTDKRPWNDCLWTSAAMLLDKWTNGDVIRTHQQLRALSGDRRGGSGFEELHVAFKKLGFSVPDSRFGQRLSWGELLSRLRRGAGAIVLGDYGDLPRWYGRWDYGFWKNGHLKPAPKPAAKPAAKTKGKAAKPPTDNHAVYVERYEPRRGRVWLMDPLGRGGWHGEWISIRSLKRFAWMSGGRVVAVTTPVATPAPFAGVRLSAPEVRLSDAAVTATWRVAAPRRWRYPGTDVHVSMTTAPSPLQAAARTALLSPAVSLDAAPARPVASVSGRTLRISAALPTTPGVYLAGMSLTERRFGRQVAASEPVAVFVPGEARATLRLNVLGDHLTAGDGVRVNVSAANAGDATWADAPGPDGEGTAPVLRTARQRNTRLVAHWIRLDGPAGGPDATVKGQAAAGETTADPGPIELLRVPLAPGELARYRGDVLVPEALGKWALVVDVEDAIAGSFAALGNAPAVAIFDVVPPRGIEAVE